MTTTITEFETEKGNMQIIQYRGLGKKMLQVTQGLGTQITSDTPGFIQLDSDDAMKLAKVLERWVMYQKDK